MADRYDERERDRERSQDPGYERYGEFKRNDWDREHRSGGAEERYRGAQEGRFSENRFNEGHYNQENRDREPQNFQDWNRNRSGQSQNRTYEASERRADYGQRGDWGRQGSWGNYGNRPDFNREDYQQQRGDRDFESYRYREGSSQNYPGANYGGASYGGGMGSYSGGAGSTQNQQGRFTGKGPKGWQRSDERIREDLNERLTDHPHIDASEIEVQVKGGEVTLTGTVEDRQAKRMAEDIAENISGVKEVHNQIRVQTSNGGQEQQGGSKTLTTSGTGSGTSGATKRP